MLRVVLSRHNRHLSVTVHFLEDASDHENRYWANTEMLMHHWDDQEIWIKTNHQYKYISEIIWLVSLDWHEVLMLDYIVCVRCESVGGKRLVFIFVLDINLKLKIWITKTKEKSNTLKQVELSSHQRLSGHEMRCFVAAVKLCLQSSSWSLYSMYRSIDDTNCIWIMSPLSEIVPCKKSSKMDK